MTKKRWLGCTVACAISISCMAVATADEAPFFQADSDDPPPGAPAGGEEDDESGADAGFFSKLPDTIFGETAVAKFWDDWSDKKSEYLPLRIGAWHWFTVDRTGDDHGYGTHALRGTYFWYAVADPQLELSKIGLDNDFVQTVGAHAEFRIRDRTKFRAFFDNKYWFYELYAWIGTPVGKFKGGQVWTRFGLDWDGTFWGNVPYFNGLKLDPDYGISWENTWKTNDTFRIETIGQFFFHDDGVNGSIVGADAESVTGSDEKNTGVVRLVPTWTLADGATIELGVSALLGRIDNDHKVGTDDETNFIIGTDVRYTNGSFRAFGEFLQSWGTRNPTRYVSGGPSDRITDFLLGTDYRLGPATLRLVYSFGWDADPGGFQSLVVPAVVWHLTRKIDLYMEYINWQVYPDGASRVEFTDGFQFVFNWNF